MTSHKRWTQAHISDLRTRIRAGSSAVEVAEYLDRNVEDVASMMVRLRLQGPL